MSDYPVSDEILEVGKADPGCSADSVTIPRARLKAYEAAVEALYGMDTEHAVICPCPACNKMREALAALRAAGILEGE